MSRDRHVLLVVAHARADWSAAVARWAASAALPAEVIRCVSIAEVRARVATGRPHSALLADAGLAGLDRDLLDEVRRSGCATLLVTTDPSRDVTALDADAVIGAPFSRDELVRALTTHARTVAPGRDDVVPGPRETASHTGQLLAVTGPGGTGASTVAMALAQGIAGVGGARRGRPIRPSRDVLLADLCRRADLAVLHDARTLTPGLREVVEAHRTATPPSRALRDDTFAVEDRGYRLLLGLRGPSHWATLQPRAVEAALHGLLDGFGVVVADCDPDLEGERETASFEVEERHHLTRTALDLADAVLVVGEPSLKGTHALVRLVAELTASAVPPDRVLLVCNRMPRTPRVRAEVARAVADLLRAAVGPAAEAISSPLGLPERPVDAAFRDGAPLPAPLPERLAQAVAARLARAGARVVSGHDGPTPVVPTGADPVGRRVEPGELRDLRRDLGDDERGAS